MLKDSLRTLMIAKDIPYPIFAGVSLRNWQNLNILMKYGPVAGFSFSESSANEISIPGVSCWKNFIIDEPISFWEKQKQRWLWPLSPRPPLYSDKVAQELDKFLREFKPNLVICEMVFVYPYLKVFKNHNCHIILDQHNIEADLFKQRYIVTESFKTKLKANIQHSQLQFIEKSFIREADQIWVCSEEDVNLLKRLYGKDVESYVVPNGINIAQYNDLWSDSKSFQNSLDLSKEISYNSERTIIFLGMLSYIPNRIASELLIEKIYPKLREIYPDCRLLLVGRNPTPSMLEIAQKDPGIIVTGGVPDIKPYLASASIMVVPLLQGGGTRFKILEAFAAGCPVVSTSKGAEGLNANDGEHLLIRDSVKEIIEGVCQIWSEPFLGKKLATNAYELVKAQYSWEAVSQNVENAIQKLL